MGLDERRRVKELQEVTLPGRMKDIEEICGVAIPYEVDWDSIKDDAAALNFLDNVSCHRLNMALRGICQDEMGKEAVRDGLKLIKLKNVKTAAEIGLTFQDGVLEMHCDYAQGGAALISDNQIQALLTKSL
jgi:hypothetical protein